MTIHRVGMQLRKKNLRAIYAVASQGTKPFAETSDVRKTEYSESSTSEVRIAGKQNTTRCPVRQVRIENQTTKIQIHSKGEGSPEQYSNMEV
jgi:hypothetical protein